MKTFIKLFSVILAALFILTGCSLLPSGEKDGESESGAQSENMESASESESETEMKEVNFKIVCPQNCERYITSLSSKIRDDINKKTTHKVTVKSDREAVTEYEILLGNTNREGSTLEKGQIGNAGWWVQSLGNVIAINARTRQGLAEAVAYFLENYTVEDNGMVRLTGESLKTEYEYDALLNAGLKLRVGSYNIKHGEMVGLDMSVLADDIKALNLDVVGLQEVDVGTGRVGGKDTVKEIAESAGYEYYYFCKAIDLQGGGYGTAILSRYPIKKFETVQLCTDAGMEGRALGHAVLDVNGVEVDYFNTHLSYEDTTVIKKQFEQLNGLVQGKKTFIITADFNTSSSVYFNTLENSVRVNHGKYFTFPENMSAIDDIVVSLGWGINDSGYQVSGHSDHHMLWAELCYDGGMNSRG